MCASPRIWSAATQTGHTLMPDSLGIGIIGMGFMGQTHARAYLAAASDGLRCSLRAVCDREPSSPVAAGNITPPGHQGDPLIGRNTRRCTEVEDLLADPSIGLVSICTPTDTHIELAIRVLDAGKHVLVEKPVATRSDDVKKLLEHRRGSDRLCVPAMCVRHWPGWSSLPGIIAGGEHGPVVHARFERLGSAPAWGRDFYSDTARSGGAVFDLHVHDADIVLWLFGRPDAVHSIGDHHHIATHYHFPRGPAVATEGGWLNDRAFPFRMAFRVEFERAVLAFDSSRTPAMTLHRSGLTEVIDLPEASGYDLQARAVVRAASGKGSEGTLPTIADALAVTRLIEAERRSADSGRVVRPEW